MTSLLIRVASALVAVGLLIGVYGVFNAPGLIVLSCLVAVLSQIEFNQIVFSPLRPPLALRILFFFMGAALFFITTLGQRFVIESWGAVLAIYLSSCLWILRGQFENERILGILATSGLGVIYLGFFPAFAIRVLSLEHGGPAFFTLLLMVFAGDTFAYFGGSWIGGRKLMESVSPKKTWSGSLSGLVGSVVGGYACAVFLTPNLPPLWMALVAIPVAYAAQSGDLFVSLVKRVARVKDSGHIMPGHGGLLDRLDGVYFAAPVYYALLHWVPYWAVLGSSTAP